MILMFYLVIKNTDFEIIALTIFFLLPLLLRRFKHMRSIINIKYNKIRTESDFFCIFGLV